MIKQKKENCSSELNSHRNSDDYFFKSLNQNKKNLKKQFEKNFRPNLSIKVYLIKKTKYQKRKQIARKKRRLAQLS